MGSEHSRLLFAGPKEEPDPEMSYSGYCPAAVRPSQLIEPCAEVVSDTNQRCPFRAGRSWSAPARCYLYL